MTSSSAPASPRLVLATHNPHKVAELYAILREALPDLADGELVAAGDLGAPDVVEDGVSFEANALIKARAAAAATGLPALADDSGLCVEVMGGAPGIFSARWSGRHGDDGANLQLLLSQLADIGSDHRRAHFECCAALVTPDGAETTSTGVMSGVLISQARGERGFGYDPIFVADGQTRTNAELSAAQKNALSHRARAFRALAHPIGALLNATEPA